MREPMPVCRGFRQRSRDAVSDRCRRGLSADDAGKKNDGQFGSSNARLMPIDYAIGVGTCDGWETRAIPSPHNRYSRLTRSG
jgi:hypothetical protein